MTNTVSYKVIDGIAIISIDNPPVNVMGLQTRTLLIEAVNEFNADPGAAAAVLLCAGRTFISGADISEFDQLPFRDPWLPEVVQTIEDAGKPIVAAIHGAALGGGLEVAMGCHFRCAAGDARLGMPEVTLGLLPGASGTQRLPRLIGVRRALDMMLTGKPVTARDALEYGLIDCIIDGDLQQGAIGFARRILEHQQAGKRLSRVEMSSSDAGPGVFSEYRRLIEKNAAGFFAPEKIIQCVEAAVELPYHEALEVEAELFLQCLDSDHSRAQRYLFFAERETARVADVPKETPCRNINTVAIIGGGTMGCGIAMNFLQANIPVTMLEVDRTGLDKAMQSIRRNYADRVSKGRLDQARMDRCLELLQGGTEYDDISDADLVIEAVFENMSVKKQVFTTLDRVCKPGAILATNTSTLDINVIAGFTNRPGDVIGLHFFAPANVMPLLEIVRAGETAKDVIATSFKLAKTIRKIGVLVGVCFGFVGNRMFLPYVREAEYMMLEGMAAERIDRVACDWGMAMGPHAVTDLSGQDVFFKINDEWQQKPDDPAYFRICRVLYEQGRYGQKTGAGKYLYEGRKAIADPEVAELARAEAEKLGIHQRQISDDEILKRMLYAMINEGALILEEGIALRPGDIDVIFANGYGLPRYRGGPMFHADLVGPARVYEDICKFRQRYGDRYWTPAPLLQQLAEQGSTFLEWSGQRS